MSNIPSLSRIIYLHAFLLISLTQAHASKTTWIGGIGATTWHNVNNWDNGIPTAMDSVIITGGTMSLKNNVIISTHAEALHLIIKEHCILSILLSTSLNVANATNFSIVIEEQGSLINFGSLTASNSFNGISVHGKFENYEDCNIHSITGSGLSLMGNSSSKNEGDFFIMNTATAFLSEGDAQFTNEGFMSLEDCIIGITNSIRANFENKGRIDISNMERHGINNLATFINYGPILLDSISTTSGIGVALLNSIGYFENNSNIVMSDILESAITNGSNDAIGVFLNTGIILVQDAGNNGLVAESMSRFTIAEDGFLTLKSIGLTPLDILKGGGFEVEDGGFLNITD